MTSPRARTRATAGPYRPVPAGREGKMLSRPEAAQARRWRDTGWPVNSIARHLRRSPTTIRAYLNGNRQPGKRASRPDTFLPFADYSRRRCTDDPHLGTRTLFAEVTALGYPGSYQTFCRALQHHQVRQHACRQCRTPRPATPAAPAQSRQAGPLPIPVALIAGEVLASYLGRLAAANHITTDDLPSRAEQIRVQARSTGELERQAPANRPSAATPDGNLCHQRFLTPGHHPPGEEDLLSPDSRPVSAQIHRSPAANLQARALWPRRPPPPARPPARPSTPSPA